jgi:hypothetical protein
MAFCRWGYRFEGPWETPDRLVHWSGIYVIWVRTIDDEWHVIDVGAADDVKERVLNHERKASWFRIYNGILYYSAIYLPNRLAAEHKKIVRMIKALTHPPCEDEKERHGTLS